MDSLEINGRRLRVRSAADKDKKGSGGGGANASASSGSAGTSSSRPVRRDLRVEDVSKHLVYAFNSFLGRQMEIAEGETGALSQEKKETLKQAQESLKAVFDLPEDDSLKVRHQLAKLCQPSRNRFNYFYLLNSFF